MTNNLEEELRNFIKKFKVSNEYFVGYIPKYRVIYWIIAVKEFLQEIQELAELIKKDANETNWRIGAKLRLVLISFRATFRITTTQLETVLLNDKNSILFEFLKLFSEHIYISHSEWSNRRGVFEKYSSKIEVLVWKIKECYHELYLNNFIKNYISRSKNSKHQEVLNTVEILEGINFTKHFPDQLLSWKNGYPDDLLFKVFIFMKLRMIASIPYLEMVINEHYIIEDGVIPIIGRALGFYFRIPSLAKLYYAYRKFKPKSILGIFENNTELLIKERIINLETIIGDSTVFKTRKDDPDGTKYHKRDAETSKVMKYQALVDPNCIPLVLIPRKGDEHDEKGFNVLKEKLIWLKEMAAKYGVKIRMVLLDAGYSSSEILEFIEKKIKAIPIVDINPRNSKTLKLIKERLEYFKQYFREILELGARFPKLAELCYYRFLDDIGKAEKELNNIKGVRQGVVPRYLKIFREIGFKEFISLYRSRTIVEGLFGMMKACYALLGRTDRRLPLKGKEQAYKHGLFILLAMQYLAYFNYKVLNRNKHLLRSLYYIKLKEIEVIY